MNVSNEIYVAILLALFWTSICNASTARASAQVASENNPESSDLKDGSLVSISSRASSGACVQAALPAANPTSQGTLEDAHATLEQILAEDWDGLDTNSLPESIRELKRRGAHRCWHKHSTFLEHLVGVHNILRLWGQGPLAARVGLFHSAYSNSYVNTALFDRENEREAMRNLVGEGAEHLVHLFCIIDRQEIVVNTLLKQGFIPSDGLSVPHLRNPGETVFLNAETLRLLLVFTMADFADQYFGWQDQLFGGGGQEGSMVIPGMDFPEQRDTKAIWPGVSKPGLWMSYISDLGQVVRVFQNHHPNTDELPAPPVFANCTARLSLREEAEARDLYWSVAGDSSENRYFDDESMISTLSACHAKNPWAFEPLVILAQKYLHIDEYGLALRAASRALELQQHWGTAWDKRMSFGAWVSWTRVLHHRAEQKKPWPTNSWDVNNFGLVPRN